MKTKYVPVLIALLASPLVLLGSPATDRQIEEAAEASYNYRTVLEDNVKVDVKDGVVTLTGTVQDQDARALAVDTVENLPGVTGVRNEIELKSSYPEKSDGWMALKIRGLLLVKANVSATSTTVDVQNGVVTLTGTADNLAQKELTGIYAAEIDGVKSVNNAIAIKDPSADRSAENNSDGRQNRDNRQTMGEKIDDASITSQVKFALLSHKSTSALKTKVTTNNGTTVITGEAANEAEKSLVTKLAQDVRGVVSVTNNMTVKVKV